MLKVRHNPAGGMPSAAARIATHFASMKIQICILERRLSEASAENGRLAAQLANAVAQQARMARRLKEAQQRSRQP